PRRRTSSPARGGTTRDRPPPPPPGVSFRRTHGGGRRPSPPVDRALRLVHRRDLAPVELLPDRQPGRAERSDRPGGGLPRRAAPERGPERLGELLLRGGRVVEEREERC